MISYFIMLSIMTKLQKVDCQDLLYFYYIKSYVFQLHCIGRKK